MRNARALVEAAVDDMRRDISIYARAKDPLLARTRSKGELPIKPSSKGVPRFCLAASVGIVARSLT